MTYHPQARRDTPLALKLKARIREHGPITVREFMTACLYDGEHGYYRARAAIGRGGDFITAPEISQVFGELIGLWCAVVWQQMGSPGRCHLVELGPGRGTMMADMLRATRRVPGFHDAVDVHLVEGSPALTELQRARLQRADVPLSWHAEPTALMSAPDLRDTPAIVVANELLDCEPRDQIERTPHGWAMRTVGLDGDERLVFQTGLANEGLGARYQWMLPHFFASAEVGSIFETTAQYHWAPLLLRQRTSAAGLFIDYGHTELLLGDTLQAVREHTYEHPLTSPGEADLTMQVDFASIHWNAREAQYQGEPDKLAVDGPVTQAEFLGGLGIAERASRLMAANPDKAAEIEAGVARLMAPTGMGTRFKAIGVRSAHLPPLPGFPAS